MARGSSSELVSRSLTLLRVFVLLSAIILAAGAFVLGSVLSDALEEQALDDAKLSVSRYTDAVLGPSLVRNGEIVVGPVATDLLQHELMRRPDIFSLKVWRADGELAWTSLAPERIGRRFPVDHHLREVLETGQAAGELENLDGAEDEAEAASGVKHVLEVYAPVIVDGRAVGAYEIYADSSALAASIANRQRLIWLATAVVFSLLWAALALLVRSASRTLTRQTRIVRERSLALGESYRRLEESALEAVESLNATVEAKDPYTAGHSIRVQGIAIAIGEELGLTPKELDALRFGGLFHDIGKIAVPDSILTKPDRLTDEEYEVIKEHSAEGARIVGKLGRLSDAVPIIRHHHERWDGRGYPDRLRGTEIPLTAAVVGLADAWDAMTTERPYDRALDFEEAYDEVRTGRGSQFVPEVVDAFFSALTKRPAIFAPYDEGLAVKAAN